MTDFDPTERPSSREIRDVGEFTMSAAVYTVALKRGDETMCDQLWQAVADDGRQRELFDAAARLIAQSWGLDLDRPETFLAVDRFITHLQQSISDSVARRESEENN